MFTFFSFPLYCGGGFGRDVIHDAVNALHLVDDAGGDLIQHIVGDSRPVGGHEIAGGDGPESQGVVVGPAITHDAHAAGVGEDSEILVHILVLAGLGDLVPEDEIGLAEGVGLLFGDLADDADGKAGTGEGLAGHQVLGQAQLPAQLADLVLEQQTQGLNDLLKVHIVRQAAHVVVALDDSGIAGAGFNHVGIDGALGQEVHGANLFGFFFKDADELLANDLALALRLADAGQLGEEAGLRVHPDEVDVPLGEGCLHLVALVQAHEAVVHEDAGQLPAHGFRQQGGHHGGIHTAAESQQHPAAAHFFPDGGDGGLFIVFHGPVTHGAADLIQEVADHLDAVFRVVDLGVVLNAVKAPALVGNGHVGAGIGVGGEGEAGGDLRHIVAVAHPGDAFGGEALKQLAGGVVIGDGLAVLPGGIVLSLRHLAAQGVGHQLAAVADAEDGYAPGKDCGVHMGGSLQIHGVGTAGKDDADGFHGLQLGQGSSVGLYLAVNTAFADTAGDELVILAAEVQNNDSLMGHGDSSFDRIVRSVGDGLSPRPGRRCCRARRIR